jgi:hypothetical protein
MSDYRWLTPEEYSVPKHAHGGLHAIYTDYWAVVDEDDNLAVWGPENGSPQINPHESHVRRRASAMQFTIDFPLFVKQIPVIVLPRQLREFV